LYASPVCPSANYYADHPTDVYVTQLFPYDGYPDCVKYSGFRLPTTAELASKPATAPACMTPYINSVLDHCDPSDYNTNIIVTSDIVVNQDTLVYETIYVRTVGTTDSCVYVVPNTDAPTDSPTDAITDSPTDAITDSPTDAITDSPTDAPTEIVPLSCSHGHDTDDYCGKHCFAHGESCGERGMKCWPDVDDWLRCFVMKKNIRSKKCDANDECRDPAEYCESNDQINVTIFNASTTLFFIFL
jgi:hypothetical protein